MFIAQSCFVIASRTLPGGPPGALRGPSRGALRGAFGDPPGALRGHARARRAPAGTFLLGRTLVINVFPSTGTIMPRKPFSKIKWKRKKGRRRKKFTIPASMRGYVRTAGYYGASRELKFHDLDVNDAAIAAGGTITEDSCLTIAQGDGESERLGRKCNVKSVNWRFLISMEDAQVTGAADVVRVILYLDKQANGATAAVTDILEAADFQSFNNLANKSRFRTLMDRTYDIQRAAGQGNGTTYQYGEVFVSDSVYVSCNYPIEYDNSATTGVIATMRSNNIGVLLLSKNGLCVFESKMRVRFVG